MCGLRDRAATRTGAWYAGADRQSTRLGDAAMISKAMMARLRKCLALAKSANEHEAAAALDAARKIMDEYGVTSADVELAEIEEAAARGSRTQRPSKWESYLCAAVRRAFSVEVFIDGQLDRRYVGRGAAPEIASYAFTVLFRQLRKARGEYISTALRRCRPGRKRARADVFCEGYAAAVLTKMKALVPDREKDPLIEQYMVKHHSDLVAVDVREAKAGGARAGNDYWNGVSSGRAAQLHGGVDASLRPLELEGK